MARDRTIKVSGINIRVHSKHGLPVGTSVWFEHADGRAVLREMKIGCDNYGYSLSLLHLSSGDKVWPAWETR